MGKKIDLNARRTTSNHFKNNNHNFNHYNRNFTNNISTNENTEEVNSSPINSRSYELPKSAKITLKIPITIHIVLTALIIFIPFIFLLLFIVIFSGDSKKVNGGGLYAYGQSCTKVTLTDTENHINDGEITLEEYLQGVVSAESNGSTNLEYLKFLAVVTRTYFFANVSSSCTVEGNSEFQRYQDIDSARNKELVIKAINETKNLVIVQDDDIVDAEYGLGCVVDKDNQYYYLRNKETNIQKISIDWVNKNKLNSELENLYSTIDTTNKNTEEVECPINNSDTSISTIGALYLIAKERYTYDLAIKYYFAEDVEIVVNKLELSGNGDFINPTNTIYCSSPFGERVHPVTGKKTSHNGLDIAISGGEPVYATKSGIIQTVEKNVKVINDCNYGYGNYVIIDHQDGTSTLYGHMKYNSIPSSITVGSDVTQGEQIGQVGSTGCSTGNHLHYEVRQDGQNVDPADYLDLTGSSGSCGR